MASPHIVSFAELPQDVPAAQAGPYTVTAAGALVEKLAASPTKKRRIRFAVGQDETPGQVEATTSAVVKDEPAKRGGRPLRGLEKSIATVMNRNEVARLAFEVDPAVRSFQSIYRAKPRGCPDWLIKRMQVQDDLVAAITLARSNQVAAHGRPRRDRHGIGFILEPKVGTVDELDAQQKASLDERIEKLEHKLWNCGSTLGLRESDKMTLSTFLLQVTRDAVGPGKIAVEMIHDDNDQFLRFRPIDAGTIAPAVPMMQSGATIRAQAISLLDRLNGREEDKSKHIDVKKFLEDEYDWVQVIDTTPRQVFTAKQCVVHNFYPVTDVEMDGWPVPPIDNVVSAVTTHINITTHNKMYFQCIASNSTIMLKEGAREIGTVLKDGEDRKDVTVWTGKKWEAGCVFRTGDKPLAITKLANGVTSRTSPDHRFRVVDSDGELGWKQQRDLVVGDYVVVNRGAVSGAERPVYGNRALGEDMAEVLGWLLGDGNVQLDRGSLRFFYHQDKERWIWERHAQALWSFGLNVKQHERQVSEEESESLKERYGFKSIAKNRIWLTVHNTDFVRWLAELGFLDSRGKKAIPPSFFSAPLEFKRAFLKGFFSADGGLGCNDWHVTMTISDETLRAQTRQMLLSLGIRTGAFEGGGDRVFSSGGKGEKDNKKRKLGIKKRKLGIKDKAEFHRTIGFLQPHKQARWPESKNRIDSSSSIARSAMDAQLRRVVNIPDFATRFDKTDRNDISSVLGGKSCSLPKLLRRLQAAGLSAPAWFGEYHFEPVIETSLTGEVVPMFDVSVYDDEHAFVADGVVVHNSGRAARGMLVITSEDVDDDVLKEMQQHFEASINSSKNAWRLPIIGLGKGDTCVWTPMEMQGARDAEFQYLTDANARTILSIFAMAPEELPGWAYLSHGTNSKALGESNNQYILEASRDLGIRPLIASFEDFFNQVILPKLDPELAKEVRFSMVGMDSESREEEATQIATDMPLHMTYNDVMRKTEKKPLPRELGGDVPLNPQFHALVLDKFVKQGVIVETLLGVKGASKDRTLDFVNNPNWIAWQQFLAQQDLQAQQMQLQSQQAQAQAAQGGQQAAGGAGAPQAPAEASGVSDPGAPSDQGGGQPAQGYDTRTENQKNAASKGADLERSLTATIDDLGKSEAMLSPAQRRMLKLHKAAVDDFVHGFAQDAEKVKHTILASVDELMG